MEQEIKEFKVFNKNIEQVSIYYGFFLIIWGVIVSFISDSSSFTSYIPSYIGLIILVFSFLSIKFFKKKKFFMHLVASFGLITFLGGLDFVRLILKGSFFSDSFHYFPITNNDQTFSSLYFRNYNDISNFYSEKFYNNFLNKKDSFN